MSEPGRTMLHARTPKASREPEQMRFAVRATSAERFWSGFEAATYDVSAGVQFKSPGPFHGLVMHLAQPANGECRCEDLQLDRVMRAGDMDVIPAGHAAYWRDETPGRALNVRLTPAIVQSAAQSLQQRGSAIAPHLQLHDPVLEHLAWALVFELEQGVASDRVLAESLGDAIALQLVRVSSSAPPLEATRGLTRRQAAAVTAYIKEHLADDLTLADLAGVVGLSPSHFKVQFKSSIGVPVHQYVIRARVDHAVRLLVEGKTRLCDVAQQSGFAHQSHLTRCMRRLLGMTPGAALRELGNDAPERVVMETETHHRSLGTRLEGGAFGR